MRLHILFTKEDAAIQRLWGCWRGLFTLFTRPDPHSSALPHTMLAARHSSPPPNSAAEPKPACSLSAAQGSPPGSKKRGWQGRNLDFLFFRC